MLNITHHARQRMAQRNLSLTDIDRILAFGSYAHRAGAIHVYLRDKDVPKETKPDRLWQRLRGTTIVLSRDQSHILTVWRNRKRGYQHIQRKTRYTHF